MKKFGFIVSMLCSFLIFGQKINFSEKSFGSWNDTEKQEKLFALFEKDNRPSETELVNLLNRLFESKVLNPNIRTKNKKESLFDVCARVGYYQAAEVVLDNGYKVDQRCFACNGETPLHRLAMLSGELKEESQGMYELILALLKKGADPDLRDMDAFTPFHLILKNNDRMAFNAFMHEEVTFNYQLATLKGAGYLKFFDKHWGDDELRTAMMEKTGLKYPPSHKEIKEKENALRAADKEKKKTEKEKKKETKKKNGDS